MTRLLYRLVTAVLKRGLHGVYHHASPKHLADIVNGQSDQLRAAIQRIAELDADNKKAWNQRDEILKDRNQLLAQLNTGPMSSDEWQIRAIRSERERDVARHALEQVRDLSTGWKHGNEGGHLLQINNVATGALKR